MDKYVMTAMAACLGMAATVFGDGLIGTEKPIVFHYHTREIPLEHLKLTTPFGRMLKQQNLPFILDSGNVENVVKGGVDTVELRLVWRELEGQEGVFDWSRLDRSVGKAEKAGLKPGLMCWFNYAPSWYHGTCFQCVTHGFDSGTLSIWDPKTLPAYDRLYAAAAARYGRRIDFVYVTGSGDFGEPVLPQGVAHYVFSAPHSHPGPVWAGDSYARQAWAKISSVPVEEVIYTRDPDLAVKYMDFLADATSTFSAECFKIIRRHFPWARYGVPIGHLSESWYGQQKSLVIKKMAAVSRDFTARWTGMGVYADFAKGNIHANRVSSAARFYGIAFGEEGAVPITNPKSASSATYENIANASSMLHSDYTNLLVKGDTKVIPAKDILFEPPVTDVALLWPEREEKIAAVFHFDNEGGAMGPLNAFYTKAAKLRARTNYETCDEVMIRDGFLKKYKTLVTFFPVPEEIRSCVDAFKTAGGKVTDGSEFPKPLENVFRTVHTSHISAYHPDSGKIEIFRKPYCDSPKKNESR